MTVTAFRLENFMAFADTGWIELRPITLLFGRNSSGKSAIIRALRLLRQSLDTPPNSPLRFVDGYGVDVGSYQQIAHGYNPGIGNPPPQIAFHFRCVVAETLDSVRQLLNTWRQSNGLPPIPATPDDYLTISLEFGTNPDYGSELRGIQLSCAWDVGGETGKHLLLAANRLSPEDRVEWGYEWQFISDLPWLADLNWEQATIETTKGFLPDLVDPPLPDLDHIWSTLCESVRLFLEKIEYSGPMRPEPQQVYILDEPTRQIWRQRGLGAWLDFLENKTSSDQVANKLDQWLQILGLGRQIHPPKKYGDAYAVVSSIVIEERENFSVNLKNMGYGASQVIPIIIQSVTAKEHVVDNATTCVIIEQPELHLHPHAQAQLADLFIDEIYTIDLRKMDEEGKPIKGYRQFSGAKFLLETHSEHLLLRLRRRIAETSIDKHIKVAGNGQNLFLLTNDLAVYFINREHQRGLSSSKEIIVDKYGDFMETPTGFEGFFSDDLKETLAIARAQIEASE